MNHDYEEPQQYAEIASEFIERNRHDNAISVLGDGLEKFPDDEVLLYLSALIDYRMDKNELALEKTGRIMSMNPGSYLGRDLQARVYSDMENYAEAEKTWISLLHDYPDDADAYASYADIMLRTLHLDKAEKLAKEALKREPESLEALRVSLLIQLTRNSTADVRKQLNELLVRSPESVGTMYTLVQTLLAERRFKEAEEVARQILLAYPDDPHAVNLLLEIKVVNHWTLIPLRPFQKFGWGASIGLWLAFIVSMRVFEANDMEKVGGIVAIAFISLVLYSWVWPFVFRKWMLRSI